jgi:hypothetical protein
VFLPVSLFLFSVITFFLVFSALSLFSLPFQLLFLRIFTFPLFSFFFRHYFLYFAFVFFFLHFFTSSSVSSSFLHFFPKYHSRLTQEA